MQFCKASLLCSFCCWLLTRPARLQQCSYTCICFVYSTIQSSELGSTSYLAPWAQIASQFFCAELQTKAKMSASCPCSGPRQLHSHIPTVQQGQQPSCHIPGGESPHKNGSTLMQGIPHAVHSWMYTQLCTSSVEQSLSSRT